MRGEECLVGGQCVDESRTVANLVWIVFADPALGFEELLGESIAVGLQVRTGDGAFELDVFAVSVEASGVVDLNGPAQAAEAA